MMFGKNKIIWKIIDSTFYILLVIFSISFFLPFHTFSLYSRSLFTILIIFFVIIIIKEIINFIQEIPQRKLGEKQKKEEKKILGLKKSIWSNILLGIGGLVFFIVMLQFREGNIGTKDCPDVILGNPEAEITIKYFYSPFCGSCWKAEYILQDFLEEKSESFRLEQYDIRYCKEETSLYDLKATQFVALSTDKQILYQGYVTEQRIASLLK